MNAGFFTPDKDEFFRRRKSVNDIEGISRMDRSFSTSSITLLTLFTTCPKSGFALSFDRPTLLLS
jgi:hypothetical protein